LPDSALFRVNALTVAANFQKYTQSQTWTCDILRTGTTLYH
jgi:hypothetical protein